MRRSVRVLVSLLVLTLTTALAACTVAPSRLVAGSTVSVAIDMELSGLNPGARSGAAAAALGVDAALYSGFAVIDSSGRPVIDPSFGRIEVVAEAPLTVRFTVGDLVRWSDGVSIDAVDLLLDWAARSGSWSQFEAVDAVTAAASLPVISPDRKSLTLVVDDAWSRHLDELFVAPMPAHVIAREVFDAAEPEVAKDLVIDAVLAAIDGDSADLQRLARFWATGFVTNARPDVLVASGPYRVAAATGDLVELEANPMYSGDRRPQLESVRLATLPLAAGLQALVVDAASVLAVAPTPELPELVPSLGFRSLTTGPSVRTFVAVERQALSGVDVGFAGERVLWNVEDWSISR